MTMSLDPAASGFTVAPTTGATEPHGKNSFTRSDFHIGCICCMCNIVCSVWGVSPLERHIQLMWKSLLVSSIQEENCGGWLPWLQLLWWLSCQLSIE